MDMYYCRNLIYIILFNYILSGLPFSPSISNEFYQSRELVVGWPSLGIVDIRYGPNNSVIAGTGSGVGIIQNSSNLNEIENNIYYISDSNLPLGSNPSLKTYDNGNFIVVSGVIGTSEEPEGTGIGWSLDGGNTWNYIDQPVDQTDEQYVTKYWNGYAFDQLSITTAVKNVSYDVDVDLEYEYIYATSWAGMLQRFKYTDLNPSWELVPLPMDGQDNLSCDFTCDQSENQSCCFYTANQSPNQNCDNIPSDYYANPVDITGFDNHKAFSVYIDEFFNYIWVGTAFGVNRGEIISENCINWVHFTRENTNTSIPSNWVTGFERQFFQDGSSRLWAVTWETNSSTPHKLSYTDDNGETWFSDDGLQQGIGAVTYSMNATNDAIYASTSKGLFEINPFIYGCTDFAADNYDFNATIDSGNCEYLNSDEINDGCDLELNYLFLNDIGNNQYQVLYNSTNTIQTINFDIIGADILRDDNNFLLIEGDGFLPFYQWNEFQPNNSNYYGGNLDASALPGIEPGCGVLLTLTLSNPPLGISGIFVNGSECYNFYTLGSECFEESQWEKIEIPQWIFDNLFIENEQNSGFKVYTSYVNDSNGLFIGTTKGLIIADIANNYNFYQPSLSNVDGFTIYPNPYYIDNESPVIFKLESNSLNPKLEIFDFNMMKITTLSANFNGGCQADGELITCGWDGRTRDGRRVNNGVYFCKLNLNGNVYWQKLGVLNSN